MINLKRDFLCSNLSHRSSGIWILMRGLNIQKTKMARNTVVGYCCPVIVIRLVSVCIYYMKMIRFLFSFNWVIAFTTFYCVDFLQYFSWHCYTATLFPIHVYIFLPIHSTLTSNFMLFSFHFALYCVDIALHIKDINND